MQAIWALLLDPKFMHAYKFGIEVLCADGIWRRVFPRFLTYSADYPEKYSNQLYITTQETDHLFYYQECFSLASRTSETALAPGVISL